VCSDVVHDFDFHANAAVYDDFKVRMVRIKYNSPQHARMKSGQWTVGFTKNAQNILSGKIL